MDATIIDPRGSIADVQISLFGGVGAATDDGRQVDIGPAKCQAVLAVLALSPGSAVPVGRIIELVWGEDPPRTADKTLQSYVVRLRKGLGPATIVRVGAAYRLDVEPEAVDVARFQRALDLGDVESALSEWTGTPLAGLDAEGLRAAVDGLVEQYLGAVEADLEQRVESDAAGSIGPLTELTATYPFREGLWALLMTALYRVGRQADALAAYRRARQHLVDDLGVEPGPRLRELESMVLGHDEELGVAASSSPLGQPTGTVTFGFSDVENSTRLWSQHRHDMAAAMARHDEIVSDAVARNGGYVFATGGDSFGVAFHRAGDAAGWAGEVQAAMADERWPGEVAIRVRIGLHTGETEERGKGYFGPAVIVAARLSAAGHGGQTLASRVTAALLDGIAARDLGVFRLDGVVAEQRILQLDGGNHPPLRTDESRRGNLPRRLGRLFGRESDLVVVGEALASSPIVTLVGPGGIGKTRLALAAARRADVDVERGAWLVELAPVGSAGDVAQAVARVLDVKERPGRTWTESIVASFGSRRAFIVLDNCEHVVEGAAAVAQAIAEGCPNVRVLATSREGLGLRDEQLIAVAPLDPAGPGVALFDERARAVSASFDAFQHRADVEEICRRLDGVPLAIELAAARTRSMSPADLVARLDDRLRLLTGGRRASVERHRTLRATIRWSYDLLTPDEQMLFRRLSIFAGPFSVEAAEAVVADDSLDMLAVDDLLGDLVDRSMVNVEAGPFGRRFRLLETMRQFGAESLHEAGRTDVIAGRHAQWCLSSVASIHSLLASPAEIEGVARLDELWPNLRAAVGFALATGDPSLARELIRPIMPESYLRARGELGEWCERILEITPVSDSEVRTWCVVWAARRYMRFMDAGGLGELVERWGEPDHPMMRYARAFIATDIAEMLAVAPTCVDLLRAQGDDYVADMFTITALAIALLLNGKLDEVDELMGELAERFRVEGPPTGLQFALTWLGTTASIRGDGGEALQLYADAAAVDVPERTHTMKNPLEAQRVLRRGDEVRAFEILHDYVQELIDQDNTYMAKTTAVTFVEVMVEADRLEEAATILGFLEASGSLDVPAWRSLLADAARRVDEHGGADASRARGRDLDDRGALDVMRSSLESRVRPVSSAVDDSVA